MTEPLNAFAVCHSICFRQTRQVINLLKSCTSNTNNENNNNNSYYYNNTNKITIMKCKIKVFFGVFRRISVIWCISVFLVSAGTRSAIGRPPDSYVRGPGFDTRSGNIFRFSFRFFKKGSCQLLAKVCAGSTG